MSEEAPVTIPLPRKSKPATRMSLPLVRSSSIASESSTTRKTMSPSNCFINLRGKKSVNVATFSLPTNPTEQFNNFKQYLISLMQSH